MIGQEGLDRLSFILQRRHEVEALARQTGKAMHDQTIEQLKIKRAPESHFFDNPALGIIILIRACYDRKIIG